MSKADLRAYKSRSMLISLYSLSGVAVLSMLSLFVFLWIYCLSHLRWSQWGSFSDLFRDSLFVSLVAVLVAIPLSSALTYQGMVWKRTRFERHFTGFIDFITQAPQLIYGTIVLALLGPKPFLIYVIFSFVAIIKLTRRWIILSSQVRLIEIESMQSLGLSLLAVSYYLYVKRFFWCYLQHSVVVLCDLMTLVTPIIFLQNTTNSHQRILSLQFFRQLLSDGELVTVFAFSFLVVHGFRFLLDQKTSFWEVEFG